MSKLAEAIRRAVRPVARPIGFGSASAERTASMIIVGHLAESELAPAAADAVLTAAATAPPAANGAASPLWGSTAAMADRSAAQALRAAGADFLVFDDGATPAAVMLEDEIGFVLRIGLDAPDAYLRAVEGLALDALLVTALAGPLTVRSTLDLRRLTAMTRKALILPVRPDMPAAELEALRDCGVVGLLVDAAGAGTLRSVVDKLTPRKRPKDTRGAPVVLSAPIPGAPPSLDEDDDE